MGEALIKRVGHDGAHDVGRDEIRVETASKAGVKVLLRGKGALFGNPILEGAESGSSGGFLIGLEGHVRKNGAEETRTKNVVLAEAFGRRG
jgi:hypothetical protein